MRRLLFGIAAALSLCFGPPSADAQESERICAAVRSYLARTSTPLSGPTFFAAARPESGKWTTANAALVGSTIEAASDLNQIYVAYVRPSAFTQPGAVSVRIAVPVDQHERPTNTVQVYRPAIGRGLNRCEPRGRYEVSRSVRLNQYIDYHNPVRPGLNSSLEDFHFSYPTASTRCARTDDMAVRQTYTFESVDRTQGDTIVGRYFGFVGPAYAVTHQYAKLKSELHFRPSAQLGTMCIGFTSALTEKPASVVVHDHGFDSHWGPVRRSLTITR